MRRPSVTTVMREHCARGTHHNNTWHHFVRIIWIFFFCEYLLLFNTRGTNAQTHTPRTRNVSRRRTTRDLANRRKRLRSCARTESWDRNLTQGVSFSVAHRRGLVAASTVGGANERAVRGGGTIRERGVGGRVLDARTGVYLGGIRPCALRNPNYSVCAVCGGSGGRERRSGCGRVRAASYTTHITAGPSHRIKY